MKCSGFFIEGEYGFCVTGGVMFDHSIIGEYGVMQNVMTFCLRESCLCVFFRLSLYISIACAFILSWWYTKLVCVFYCVCYCCVLSLLQLYDTKVV